MRVFPIRHHGPGSAFALQAELRAYQPDIILVEGASDATPQLHWLNHAEMVPPVALLSYRPDEPKKANIAPMAVFSPEYNAIRYGHEQGVPVRYFDIPYWHLLALNITVEPPPADPFYQLGRITGYRDYERWWNFFVEQRIDHTGIFVAVNQLVAEMRPDVVNGRLNPPALPDNLDDPAHAGFLLSERREAYMRQEIRRAMREGFLRIAIICGAWHAPALKDMAETENRDQVLLNDLVRVPVEHTWIPWTYGRISTMTGYRAGIRSPGWYHHLWQMKHQNGSPTDVASGWLMQVAHLLRDEDLDASPAHVIEAVRLAEALAAVRDLPFPGLEELNDAVQSVMCAGRAEPLKLIYKNLIVGERMGEVPGDVPLTPLQRDLRSIQRRLKFYPSPDASQLKLDLRKDVDKEKSSLLHRLNLLDIPWGRSAKARGLRRGTYSESWQLKWVPDFNIKLVTAGMWGNTVVSAVENRVISMTEEASSIKTLTELLDKMILADLPEMLAIILKQIETQVSLSSDVIHMLQAIPPLARIMRYGDVRQTDQSLIQHLVESLLVRACIGLPTTCAAVDDRLAQDIYEALSGVQPVIGLIDQQDVESIWYETLLELVDMPTIHGLLGGSACRYLFHAHKLSAPETAERVGRVLSISNLSGQSSEKLIQIIAWLDGFLRGADLVLVHDKMLWGLVNDWVVQLSLEQFTAVLPLLRRIFSTYSRAVREQLGRRSRGGEAIPISPINAQPFYDFAVADQVIPYLETILGAE